MSTFQVPFSSSPPEPTTPGATAKRNGDYNSSSYLSSHPSTTPAGPPPSSIGSFTPAEPPPPSLLGSSKLGSGKTLFKSSNGPRASSRIRKHESPTTKSYKSSLQLEQSSRFSISRDSLASMKSTRSTDNIRAVNLGEWVDDYQEEDDEPDLDAFNSSLLDSRGLWNQENQLHGSPAQSAWRISQASPQKTLPPFVPRPSLHSSPRGVKRSRGGATIGLDSGQRSVMTRRQGGDSALSSIVRSMASQTGSAKLVENDDFILDNEKLLDKLNTAQRDEHSQQHVQTVLSKSCEEFCHLWKTYLPSESKIAQQEQDSTVRIGPSEDAPPFEKAIFIGILLLSLHHPPPASGQQALALSLYRSVLSPPTFPGSHAGLINPAAMPKTLIEWLDKFHNPWRTMCIEVETRHPSPSAHYNFWDMVFVLILRGKLRDAIRILEKSDFHYAETAPRDGQVDGYTEKQVRNVQMVVGRAIEVLRRCPAIVEDDWYVAGNDWAMFRKLVDQALDELISFAEDRPQASDPSMPAFESTSLALSSTTLSHSQIARRAESRIPWTIYQSLRALYGILLGGETEMLASAQDWVEATMGLTIWWTGDDNTGVSIDTLARAKHTLREARSKRRRLVDVDCEAAYMDRLSRSFRRATNENNEEDFQINSNDPVEVCMACVFEDDFEGVTGILHGWSIPVTAAVVEIATLGGWFSVTSSASHDVMKGFDESDLMILSSYDQQQPPLRRHTIMIEYADALFERGVLTYSEGRVMRDGWQLSIAALARIGDLEICRQEIVKILSNLPIDSDARIDEVLSICLHYEMADEGHKLAEKYADSVAETSDDYGKAITYYARGNCRQKTKNVLDLLVSMSIVQSAAFPPTSSLDESLHDLLFDSTVLLNALSSLDRGAAATLHTLMSGYATLRKFYDLRDQDCNQGPSSEERELPAISLEKRKREAVEALVAVIQSASDNIDGGLFDKGREAVVPVEGLLSLLGEAMIFVDQPNDFLDLNQYYALTKAVKNLQTVSADLYDQCESCVQSTLASYHGHGLGSSPRRLLKTMSSMTSASSFSLVGSSMLDSQPGQSIANGGAHVDGQPRRKRGWDWRAGMAKGAKGEDILRMLRLRLAKGIAKYWMDGEEQ